MSYASDWYRGKQVLPYTKSGVKIRGVHGWTVHRCPTLRPPFWPPLVLKFKYPFHEKLPLSSKTFTFARKNCSSTLEKSSSTVKKSPFARKSALFLEKSASLLGKSTLLNENNCPFAWKKCPFAKKMPLFWLVHRCPNFLFSPLHQVYTGTPYQWWVHDPR